MTAVLATALALTATAACGSGPQDGASSGGSTGRAPHIRTEDDIPPLPFDDYWLGDRDTARFTRAQDRLAQQCMIGLGFTDFPLHPDPTPADSSSVGLTAVASTPFGLLDRETAGHWGYGFDPHPRADGKPHGRAMTAKESAVMYGQGTSNTVHGGKVPEDGCSGQAMRALTEGVDRTRMWSYPSKRGTVVDKSTEADARVRAVQRAWADCVENKGYGHYASPQDAMRDTAWGRGQDGNTTHSRREIGTAVADVDCKREHNTAGRWWSVLAEKQRGDIRRHKAAFDAVRHDLARVRSHVRKALT